MLIVLMTGDGEDGMEDVDLIHHRWSLRCPLDKR